MEERKGLIYIITNKINGKQYVGQTISKLNDRWAGHKCDIKRKKTVLSLALIKYSPENFEIRALEEDINYSELDEKEIAYIKEYNTVSPNGYNISRGGQSFRTDEERIEMSERVSGEKNPMFGMHGELNPFYGKTHSEESVKLMSNVQKKIWADKSEEELEKQRLRLRQMHMDYLDENGGPMLGKNHSQESKDKIQRAMIGRVFTDEHKKNMSENHPKKTKVQMIDKNTKDIICEFDSMTIAANWIRNNSTYKAMAGQISTACSGKVKSAYGYIWERAD